MKSRYILLLLLLLLSFSSYSQGVSETAFINADWFSVLNMKDFMERDSVALMDMKTSWSDQKLSKAQIKACFNNNAPVTDFKFAPNGNLFIGKTHRGWCGTVTRAEGWSWHFDENAQVLKILYKKNLRSAFKVVSKGQDSKSWKYEVVKDRLSNFYAGFDLINLVKIE